MNFNPIKANMTELELDGITILFSYKTPVACKVPSQHAGQFNYYVTDKKWSNTTTRHINLWTNRGPSQVNPQSFFDNLIAEVK